MDEEMVDSAKYFEEEAEKSKAALKQVWGETRKNVPFFFLGWVFVLSIGSWWESVGVVLFWLYAIIIGVIIIMDVFQIIMALFLGMVRLGGGLFAVFRFSSKPQGLTRNILTIELTMWTEKDPEKLTPS